MAVRFVVPIVAVVAALLDACAFVPKTNPRLEEARSAYAAARSDPQVSRFAARELEEAGRLLEQAIEASNTLADPAVVDHLAYLAKQRVEISREVARRMAPGPPR